jgi:predicted nucleotidyltransferase
VTVRNGSSTSARVRYADPEAIRRAVDRFAAAVRAAHPEVRRIRWFGSWVSGGWSPGSDVDLCIVVDRCTLRVRERAPAYLPRTFPVGIDLFVYTEEELEHLGNEHPSFARAIESGVEV